MGQSMGKTEIDIETLLHWAYRDELSKRHTSAAEGIWDRIREDGQRGGVDKGDGGAQRYSHFGLPDPDAERIEVAVGRLGDMVIDWQARFDDIAGDIAGLITVNDMPGRVQHRRAPRTGWGPAGDKALQAWWGPKGARPLNDRPRDVLMVGSLRTAALVTMHAIRGTRPDWREDPPRPIPTPARKGPNAMVMGECKGRNLYSLGAQCPLIWEPSPMTIVSSRAEYVAWHQGLVDLAAALELAKFAPLPPKAPPTPWNDPPAPVPGEPIEIRPEVKLSTLPLAPHRGRKAGQPHHAKAGPVRYPLEGEVA